MGPQRAPAQDAKHPRALRGWHQPPGPSASHVHEESAWGDTGVASDDGEAGYEDGSLDNGDAGSESRRTSGDETGELPFRGYAQDAASLAPVQAYHVQLGEHLGIQTIPGNPFRRRMRRSLGKADDPHGLRLREVATLAEAAGATHRSERRAQARLLRRLPSGTGKWTPSSGHQPPPHILADPTQAVCRAPHLIAEAARRTTMRFKLRVALVAAVLRHLDAFGLNGTRFPHDPGNPEDVPQGGQEVVWSLTRRLRRTSVENPHPMLLSRSQVRRTHHQPP
eukprot:scaffold1340_cov253-Pinguiococcus_pyrenoidosus.AAC.36